MHFFIKTSVFWRMRKYQLNAPKSSDYMLNLYPHAKVRLLERVKTYCDFRKSTTSVEERTKSMVDVFKVKIRIQQVIVRLKLIQKSCPPKNTHFKINSTQNLSPELYPHLRRILADIPISIVYMYIIPLHELELSAKIHDYLWIEIWNDVRY